MKWSHKLLFGFACGLGGGVATQVAAYAVFFPTSDVRTRIYIMLGAWPFTFLALFLPFMVIPGLVASRAAGVASASGQLGVILGTLASLVVLFSRVLSFTVWMHEEDVSPVGQAVRVLIAVLLAVGTALWVRGRVQQRSRAAT